jgi:hypothetical protein
MRGTRKRATPSIRGTKKEATLQKGTEKKRRFDKLSDRRGKGQCHPQGEHESS